MRKTVLCLLLALLLLQASAGADVIWEPMDAFYLSHRMECTEVDQTYEALIDTQWYDEPGGRAGGNIAAGETVYIGILWSGGWGETAWRDRWVDMKGFRRLYDARDFDTDHSGEYARESHVLTASDGVFLLDGEPLAGQEQDSLIAVWTWPVSGKLSRTFSVDMFAYSVQMEASPCWRDAQGRLWGHVSGYLYGSFDGWVCLSDPLNQEIPGEGPTYADEAPAPAEPGATEAPGAAPAGGTPGTPGGSGLSLALPAALVVLAMLTAAVILCLMRRKAGRTAA